MDAQEKYEYWLDTAEYDLVTAEAMLKAGRWLYVVFTCQQAIEKLSKGLYTLYIDDNVPYTHNISGLIEKIEKLLPEPVTDERYNLFESLTSHYLNGRYANFKQKLNERLSERVATDYLERSKEAFAWLLTMKP
ncbi:MAG: HEPN domain-containing protein [Deltaproteobacteria bacterium]|jgi:HEPN domain-containing protein|nr:HEPN domain-containing protein [Deltaproteobacteria bacterium]